MQRVTSNSFITILATNEGQVCCSHGFERTQLNDYMYFCELDEERTVTWLQRALGTKMSGGCYAFILAVIGGDLAQGIQDETLCKHVACLIAVSGH
jgi:hypothetical protein